MNVKEFISSGLLEAYVLGAASDAERKEVEQMIALHPEVKAELEAIEDTMFAYAQRNAVEPPAGVKEKILKEITSTPRVSSVSNKEPLREYRIEPAIIEPKKAERNINVYAIAASLLLLVSLPVNIYLYMRLSSNESKMSAMLDKQNALTKSIQDSALAYLAMRNEHYVLNDPMFKMIELKGLKASPDSKALACWCPDSKELYFSPEKLPAAPKGMQYQLWAIVDGKPVDAGMIKMDSGLQKMKLIANASAFAVTLEKEGGSDAPHGDMYVMGTI